MLRPSIRSGFLISWSGMRGILSLAAALALPPDFPYRGLIVLTAFSVVLGTLVIQGLTLKPLLRALDLKDDDPIGREHDRARARALRAALAAFEQERSPVADALRKAFKMRLAPDAHEDETTRSFRAGRCPRAAIDAAREEVLKMRASGEIGDDAFHLVEEDLDWLEMTVGARLE